MNEKEKIKIEDLGYTPFFEAGRNQLGLKDFPVARVISEYKEAYKVKNENGEYFAKITGKQIFEASGREDYPAVGDWVAITLLDEDHAVIQGVLPRLTMIKRKAGDKNKAGEKDKTQIIATNIDTAFVIQSVGLDYNLNRFERYFAIVENGGVKPAIILNKIDLISAEELEEKLSQLRNRFPYINIIPTSTVNNEGLNELRNSLYKGKTYCLLGSSGVGKSSLINKLLGEEAIKTGEISSYAEKGKHVTTARQMHFLDEGGIVIDNPGMREIGMGDTGQGIDNFFNEITELSGKCRYADCTHTHEPGCEVINALESGMLDKEKYQNYIKLKKEAEFFEMNDLQKRDRDRQFGKLVRGVKKDLKKYKG